MRRTIFSLVIILFILVVAYLAVGFNTHRTRSVPVDVRGNAERGAYLVRLAGCVSCHTDADNGGELLAGGRRIVSGFGTFVSPNITPDGDTGIGGWSDAEFVTAVTLGVSPDGGHYYPAFPYTSYTRMTVQDVVDIKVYLDSVNPVSNDVSRHDIDFPFNLRSLLGWWKWLYFDAGEYTANRKRSESWNRGAYIVQGPGHCGECHTARNLLGGKSGHPLSGNANGPDGEAVPRLTGKPALDGWTREDLEFALEIGMKPDGDSFSGSMAEVVEEGTAHYSEGDRAAVAEYLLSAGR